MRKKISKILAWVFPVLVLVSIGLVLRPPERAAPAVSAEAARSFEQKLEGLLAARERGQPAEVRLNEAEVNSKLEQILGGAPAGGLATLSGASVHLAEGRLECVLAIRLLGAHVYITLGGEPSLRDHELEFHLTEAKLGTMPVPAPLVAEALRERLASPEVRPLLRLPGYLSELRVENGELLLRSQ